MIPENWSKLSSNSINAVTREKIQELFTNEAIELPKLKRAGRDQLKVVTNIIELARAFIGDVTTTTTRRLEKIYALRICQSKEIKKVAVRILKNALQNNLLENIKTGINLNAHHTTPTHKFQYSKYYFPEMTELSLNGLIHFLKWTFEQLTAEVFTHEEDAHLTSQETAILTKIKGQWVKFPENIRLAILFNDITRGLKTEYDDENFSFYFLKIYKKSSKRNESETFKLGNIGFGGTVTDVYGIDVNDASDKDALQFVTTYLQNEYDETIQTYRIFLMPLSGNDGGHVTQCITSWIHFNNSDVQVHKEHFEYRKTKDVFPAKGGAVIACLLFSFWRLYYDRRLSSYHTLLESFERTNTAAMIDAYEPDEKNLFPDLVSTGQSKRSKNEIKFDLDALSYLNQSIRLGGRFIGKRAWMIHPMYLMDTLYKAFYLRSVDSISENQITILDHQANFERLSEQVDSLRDELTDQGFFIPRFSYEFSQKTGFDVKPYVEMSKRAFTADGDPTELIKGVPIESSLRVGNPSKIITFNLKKSVRKIKVIVEQF